MTPLQVFALFLLPLAIAGVAAVGVMYEGRRHARRHVHPAE